jgi:hypothetical protein
MVFVVAVLLRPEVQTMAQKELDAVTKTERLPMFEDRSMLPFVDTICKEVMRWKPVTPLGEYYQAIAHRSKRCDDSQVCPVKHQKMMSTMVSSFPRVGTICVLCTDVFRRFLIHIYSSDVPARLKSPKPGMESWAQAKPTGWLAGPHGSASMF